MRLRDRNLLFFAAVAIFLAFIAYTVAVALTGGDLGDARDDALLVLLPAGLLALVGWLFDRRDVSALAGAEERTRRRLEAELREREQALEQERAARSHLDECRRNEKRMAAELRRKMSELRAKRGPLADPTDMPAMVLRIALTLVEADKGILLSRRDEDSDGDLDLAAAEGFENDPVDSAVAQHFATQVLEQDQTVRENDLPDIDAERRTPADEEIENLVAIPIYIREKFNGVVVCANRPGGFGDYDDDVLLAIGNHAGAVLENARLQGELRTSYLATLRMLGEAIEAKDPFLRSHSGDVSRYVSAVADRLGFDPKLREELVFASLLHDVGKIGISERILLKPAALTPEERSVVELHPRIGYRLVDHVPALRGIAPGILHHHERFDGDGYPARLRGEQIPLEGRIIAVADAFSAMTAERPYRARMSVEEACGELERCAGTQFDPEVVRLFVEEVRRAPPPDQPAVLATVLADPELETRRRAEEPVLGFASFAIVDNLTLLYCRRYFHEVAAAEAERAAVQNRPFAVVLAELTELDEINRREGYAAGDAAIEAAARAVERVAARVGGTAARYSGARLGVIVPGADERAAERIADEIASELGDGRSVRVVSTAWQPGDDGEDVIDRARLALLGDRAAASRS